MPLPAHIAIDPATYPDMGTEQLRIELGRVRLALLEVGLAADLAASHNNADICRDTLGRIARIVGLALCDDETVLS